MSLVEGPNNRVHEGRVSAPRQILVEGRDAQIGTVRLLADCFGYGLNDCQVWDFGGQKELKGFLRTFVRRPGFAEVEAIAVVSDAETDPAAQFQSVGGCLRTAHLEPPECVGSIRGDRPNVGVFLFPGGSRPGILETVLLESVSGEPGFECVNQFFSCAAKSGRALPSGVRKPKAEAVAYLALVDGANGLVGRAAEMGVWNWRAEPMRPLLSFLEQFFATSR